MKRANAALPRDFKSPKDSIKHEKAIYRGFLYILPLCLYFSYYPVISLDGDDTMNYELSVSLIWLILFDIYSFFVMVFKFRQEARRNLKKAWPVLLFLVFAIFSCFWSLNTPRAVLTAGVLMALVLAVFSFSTLKGFLNAEFWRKFLKWFVFATIFACIWCIIQCILDLFKVGQEVTLLCDGCVYEMFGFPHPNGFAIEPQFMGNLLLAPVIIMAYLILNSQNKKSLDHDRPDYLEKRLKPEFAFDAAFSRKMILINYILFFFFSFTLFLTFSRGAIYAGSVGLAALCVYVFIKTGTKERRGKFRQILVTFVVFVLSFFTALRVQGVMAAVSPTSDTFLTGVNKVINHLSLGRIDFSTGSTPVNQEENEMKDSAYENSGTAPKETRNDSVFSGYVAESTGTRLRLADFALKIWSSDIKTMLIGVGLGGAGQALYNHGLSPTPKEIVQNEYASVLLETGLIGAVLLIFALIFVMRAVLKMNLAPLLISLIIAYAVSFLFFSGLPNALHIFLIPGVIYCCSFKKEKYYGSRFFK